ncbi:MAG: FHA domain-containing protein [Verrucomicrobia bacterium]|nr:FHA domain-containing protein [Verrucomicrobiota bacterium]
MPQANQPSPSPPKAPRCRPGEPIHQGAWLELSGDETLLLRGSCAIGRSPSNPLVLADERVSRRHAIIHAQEQNQF